MGKPNYQQMKKQREAARKARQMEKITRKMARAADPQTATESGESVEATPPKMP